VEERSRNGLKESSQLETTLTATTVEVQALNSFGVRRMAMAMAVFLGGRLTLSDQDGIQCQVGCVVGSRYSSMGNGAKEMQDYMESYIEYAVEYRVHSIVVVDFVFYFVLDDTKILFSTEINTVLLL
jgi:hypothetical protein